MKLEYQDLQNAVRKTHNKLTSREWNLENANAYLRVHGLATNAIKNVLDNADRCVVWENIEAEKDKYATEYKILERDRERFPELYTMWRTPAMWDRNLKLEQVIDVIMHLLFLGCQKTITLATQDFLQVKGKGETFLRFMEGTLESIQKLNLSWCKALPYRKGTCVGWVSENLLAFSRLSKWVYSQLPEIASTTVEVDLDLAGKSKWTKDKCVRWLRMRGLDTKGNAAEVKQRVESYFHCAEGIPPVLNLPNSDDIKSVHVSLSVLVARVMTRSVTEQDCLDLEVCIKLFLTYFDIFDSKIQRERERATWITTYNFPSLLNIPDAMRLYGPLRNLWEGGYLGEGMLVYVKPEAIYGMRKNWNTRLLERIHDTKAIEQLESVLEGYGEDARAKDDSADYRRYGSVVDVVADFGNGKPLSVVVNQDGSMGCRIGTGETVMVTFDQSTAVEMYGLWYFDWRMTDDKGEVTTQTMTGKISDSILLLPMLGTDGKPVGRKQYCAISSNWMEMGWDGGFHMPTIRHS
jgi:hypothetical protein